MAANNNASNNKGSHSGDGSGKTLFGNVDFEEDNKVVIRRILERKMQPEHLSTRVGAGRTTFTYVESWKAIELANGIFGFDGWSSSITDMILDFIEPVCGGARFKCGVTAIVRVTLKNGSFHEDVGFGIGENKCKGTALEKAKKEAVSDARKRALRLFGNALGNSVYDKEFIESIDLTTKRQPGRMGNQNTPSSSSITYEGIRQSERSFSSPISRNGLPLPNVSVPPLTVSANEQNINNQQTQLKNTVQIQGPPVQLGGNNNYGHVNGNNGNVTNNDDNENSLDTAVSTANEGNENDNDDASFLDGFVFSQAGADINEDSSDKQQPSKEHISPIQSKQINNNNNNNNEIDDDTDLFGKLDLDEVMLFDEKETSKQKTPSPQSNSNPSSNDTVLVPETTKHQNVDQQNNFSNQQQHSPPGMPPKVNISQFDQVKRNLFMHGTQSPQSKGINASTPQPRVQVIPQQQQQQQPPPPPPPPASLQSSTMGKNYSRPPPSKRFTIIVGKK